MTIGYYNGISGSSIEFLGERVRKTACTGKESKLIAQYTNLLKLRRRIAAHCVQLIGAGTNYYYMAFCPGVSFDVYCTMCTQQIAFVRLKEIISVLWDELYSHHDQSVNLAVYVDYLIKRVLDYARCGRDTSRLIEILKEVKSRLNGRSPLETSPGGLVHGDLTFENIMVTADSFVLIDSNPPPGDVGCMGLDAGKIRQSLFSYYELSKYSGPMATTGLKATYSYLANRFSSLFPFWNESLDLQSRFYEASHYIRLLDYKYHTHPSQADSFYGQTVHLLEEVLDELSFRG